VAGNQPSSRRVLLQRANQTANIVIEMGYAADLHREALFGTAVVLFVFILIINLSISLVKKKERL
jgi:phosphate transport system permease protein